MTVAFGSTREMRWAGTAIFANAPFGLLEEECRDTSHVTVGKGRPEPLHHQPESSTFPP